MARILRQDNTSYNDIANKIPVCFLIDKSGSMNTIIAGDYQLTGQTGFVDQQNITYASGGITLMDKLNEGIANFYKAMSQNITTKNSCETAVVSFSDTAKLETVNGFASPDPTRIPQFKANGNDTYITPALRIAIDELAKRKEYYKKNRITYYQPWLVIFTDGQPTDDVTEIQRELMKLQMENKLTVYTMALSNEKEDIEALTGFSKNKPVDCSTPEKIKDFFEFLSPSVSNTAAGGATPEGYF